ncbi:hypothetical protein MMC24_006708 [Lignoscripta atroalba]|nr:hypothetical protein [Lignoscripta atroalba]
MRHSLFTLPAGLLALLATAATASLPYNPTTVLSSAKYGGDLVYIFQSTSATTSSFQLLAVNTSDSFTTTDLAPTTVSATLPFLTDGDSTAFTALIDSGGTILVYTGPCEDGVGRATLWSFTPSRTASGIEGTWVKKNLDKSGLNGLNDGGPKYLASGIAFSSTVDASSDIYVFGGMCPIGTSSSVDEWQGQANYSNTMLTIQPESSSSPMALVSSYDLKTIPSRGPPIPEAGLSITPLEPTFFNMSDGNETRQQNFVLLGGHTRSAFINMSQVALFSLPEQSWSFLPVNEPTSGTKTDLAVRESIGVDPRSGHTAILTSDGKQIVVFGGWVGDLQTPAIPQLVILGLGEGFGGDGDWQWIIPDQQGEDSPKGAGLYGHGAVILPGEVMMVVGGYVIPAFESGKLKRADPSPNTDNHFFNITSGSWITNYTRPITNLGQQGVSDTSGITGAKRAGLGAGLAFGVAAIIGVVIVYFCYSRRLKGRREAREKELRELALGAQSFHSSALGLGGIDGRGGEKSAVEWMSGTGRNSRDAYPWAARGANGGGFGEASGWNGNRKTEAERTGLLVEIPSPTRGLRRSLHSRGVYQPAPRYDDGRRSRGSGTIHRIDERDEYEQGCVEPTASVDREIDSRTEANILSTVPVLDPFRDLSPFATNPNGVLRTPSPQSPARERELEQLNWANDWTAANALMQNHVGRVSPDKTDRTSSTLSERSMRSTLSAHSVQQSIGTLSRSMSQRSAAFPGSNLFSTASNTTNPAFDGPSGQGSPQYHGQTYGRSQSLTLGSAPLRTNTSDTFATAASTFPQLQSEGEALLGGRTDHIEKSPNRTRSRTKGWMGSMRRAFTGLDRSNSTSPDSGERSAASSPTKNHHCDEGLPRRAASAGAMLWRRRQGARDWDVEGNEDGNEASSLAAVGGADDEEWDIESAVERRVVQVMFTVPRERLRVVNGGPEGDGESIVSVDREKAKKRDEKGDLG